MTPRTVFPGCRANDQLAPGAARPGQPARSPARRLAGRHHYQPERDPALIILGSALRQARRFDEAIAACQDAAAIYRQTAMSTMRTSHRANLDAARAADQAEADSRRNY
jgi:hypothetical protein